MTKISVVMPSYNAESFVAEAIESVLKQSFADFEFIIVDDGSTDNTLSIIRSYNDKRIKLIENSHDFVGSLNIGLSSASSKYIARMDADDIMHTDRLKIQYAIMEEESSIIVCGTWMMCFGENKQSTILCGASGLVEKPLLGLMQSCFMSHPTVMLRTDFLRQHRLEYDKKYVYAEDFKFWVEIAKKGGLFYVESQPLLYYRMSDQQVGVRKREEQAATSLRIRKEVLEYLLEVNSSTHPSFKKVANALQCAKDENLITDDEVFDFFFMLFTKNKNSVITG